MKLLFFITALSCAAVSLPAERLVFDMPAAHTRHLNLLRMMDAAHARGDFYAMGALCRQGIELKSADSLWSYNLACALSLQNKKERALEALKKSIDLGFHDLEHIKADEDLNNLRALNAYEELLDDLQKKLESESLSDNFTRRVRAFPPNADNTVLQAADNTIWSFATAMFNTFIAMKAANSTNTTALKTENDAPFMLYVNRDNKSHDIDFDNARRFLKLNYCDEMRERRQHIGAPNTLFIDHTSGELIPVLGNSSMGFINSAYWRCQPRAFFTDPNQLDNQITLFLGNQLFFYPTYSDYDVEIGDLFPANTPFYVAVSGATKAERTYIKAIADAISALPAQTRQHLTSRAMLMPTMQLLLRKSQRAVNSPEAYMSGIAHPVAFQPQQLDYHKLISNARSLTTNNIPPLLLIKVEDDPEIDQSLDMPTCVYSEHLFDAHLAAARVFRAFPYRRAYRVTTRCQNENAEIHCSLLQGDPKKVSFARSPEDADTWRIEVAHHEPFTTPIAGGGRIVTTRVDIGFFAKTKSGISLPAILSINFLSNETRKYDDQERLLSIEYRRGTTPYTDPILSFPRNWRDEFKHDSAGRITGWSRIRTRKKEHFTAYGDLAIQFDDKGRATKARRITYTKRYIGDSGREGGTMPSLAQVDDNIEVTYSYACEDDYIGKPDAKITRKLAPPVE